MSNVVQVQAAHRQRDQVVGRRRRLRPPGKRGVPLLKRPGNEGPEPSRLVLKVPDPAHMLHPFLQGLHAAKHHGCRSGHPQSVRLTHDVQPGLCPCLPRSHFLPDPVHHYLRAAARQRIQSRRMQSYEGLPDRQPTTASYVNDFGRRQGVYIYWILGLDGREEVFIVVNIQVRVEATLHQDPRPPKFQCLFYLGEYLLLPEEITVTRAGGTVEGAEVTLSQTEVSVIDVAVNNERDLLLRDHASPLLHRQGAKGEKIPGPQHLQGVLVTHPIPTLDSVQQGVRQRCHISAPVSLPATVLGIKAILEHPEIARQGRSTEGPVV